MLRPVLGCRASPAGLPASVRGLDIGYRVQGPFSSFQKHAWHIETWYRDPQAGRPVQISPAALGVVCVQATACATRACAPPCMPPSQVRPYWQDKAWS